MTAGPVAAGAAAPCDVVDDWCRGWLSPEPRYMRRASHAVGAGDGVWLIDPVDEPGMVDAALAMGPPVGVLQLLDRHGRDCAAVAARLGVPHHEVPASAPAGAPFRVIPVVGRSRWREVAVLFEDRRALVVADALGTAPYFRAPGERLGPHPLLRLFGPPRVLTGLGAAHLLCGHGEGLHGDGVAGEIDGAIASARRRVPGWALSLPRARA